MDTPPTLRLATSSDADGIAALHADSWRRHYHGAYSDSFLDSDELDRDRLDVWRRRLEAPTSETITLVAEYDDELIGFAHTVLDADPIHGALLDNLHVSHQHQRLGVGARLLAGCASHLMARRSGQGLYLWVLEQNVAAQAFYEACGGARGERALTEAPGGIPSRLNGSPSKLRYAWADPSILLKRMPRKDT